MGVLPCSRQLTVTKQKRETNKGGSPPATARLCFDRCGGLVLLRMASRLVRYGPARGAEIPDSPRHIAQVEVLTRPPPRGW